MRRFYSVLKFLVLALISISASAAIITEDFAEEPQGRGWRVHGNDSLFTWHAAREALAVTWDSSAPNSFFYRTLGRTLDATDDFAFEFQVEFESIEAGTSPGRSYTFQLAAGLLKLEDATSPGFIRGTGTNAVNLAEFNYFPDTGLGATVSPVIVTDAGRFHPSFAFPMPLLGGNRYTIRMAYTAADRTLRTRLEENGEAMGDVRDVRLPAGAQFRVDAFSINSYSDAGSGGSLRAQGWIDDVRIEFSVLELPELALEPGDEGWLLRFEGRPGWIYTVERSLNLSDWTPVSETLSGNGELVFRDASPAEGRAFYRVRAQRQ